jgi:hypothetical protein
MVIDMSIGAHKKVDLVLKNKSLKKSKVVIGIGYESGEKKFKIEQCRPWGRTFLIFSFAPSGL